MLVCAAIFFICAAFDDEIDVDLLEGHCDFGIAIPYGSVVMVGFLIL